MAEKPTTNDLTTRQHSALSALMSEPTIRKASEVAGVPERTLYKWLKESAFQEAYRGARRDATQQAIARLQQFSSSAAATLVSLMAGGNPPAIRLAAARSVLELAIKSVELEDIAARLEALEQAHAAKHKT